MEKCPNHLQEIDTRSVPVVQQSAPASDEGEVVSAVPGEVTHFTIATSRFRTKLI